MREYNEDGEALLTDEEAVERYLDEWYETDNEVFEQGENE